MTTQRGFHGHSGERESASKSVSSRRRQGWLIGCLILLVVGHERRNHDGGGQAIQSRKYEGTGSPCFCDFVEVKSSL